MVAGDLLWTGPFIDSTERVVSGLVHRFGPLDFVSDNTGVFADSSFVEGGCVVPIGGLLIYMATVVPDEYPGEVLSGSCSTIGSVCDEFSDHAEVFTASELPNRRPAAERPTPSFTVCFHTRIYHDRNASTDRKSTRLNSSHITRSRMPSSA